MGRAGRPALPLRPERDHPRRLPERPGQRHHGPQRVHPGQGRHLRRAAGATPARSRPHGVRRGVPAARRDRGVRSADRREGRALMGRLWGDLDDVTADAGYDSHPARVGFFTDTSVCIGCKACEVACKTWNEVPDDGYLLTGMSYDNTQALGASTWRHVAFVEKPLHPTTTDLGLPGMGPPGAMESGVLGAEDQGAPSGGEDQGVRWLMSSDVCK